MDIETFELAKSIYAQKCALHRGAIGDKDIARSFTEAINFVNYYKETYHGANSERPNS